jgi:hypothetical protein
MKIISKHKDYYDHMIGIYGRDELIVYDRRLTSLPEDYLDRYFIKKHSMSSVRYEFYICGKIYRVVLVGDKSYHQASDQLDWRDNIFLDTNRNKPTNINEKFRLPVLARADFLNRDKFSIPILSGFGFASRIPPEEMYQKIYTFLSWLKDNPTPEPNQTDKEKVQSHGFDLKTSFRPNIKKNLK